MGCEPVLYTELCVIKVCGNKQGLNVGWQPMCVILVAQCIKHRCVYSDPAASALLLAALRVLCIKHKHAGL